MAPRDVELDVATLLQAAGHGSLSGNPPTLYAGPFPATAPDAMIACLASGGEQPAKYLGGDGTAVYRPKVTVLVRGARGAGSYANARQRSCNAWQSLYEAQRSTYLQFLMQEPQPNFLGRDENGRPQFSFTVQLEYSE